MCKDYYRIIQKILVVIALLAFLAFLLLFVLDSASVERSVGTTAGAGVFRYSSTSIARKYYEQVSPNEIVITLINAVVYLWNAAAILYIFVSLWLPERKSPVNVVPTLIPISFLIEYILAFGLLIGSLFAYDKELLILTFCLLLVSLFSLISAVSILYKRVYDNLADLEADDSKTLLLLVRVIIQNGLFMLTTWQTVNMCIVLAQVIIYNDSQDSNKATQRGIMDVEDSSSVILALLFAFIILWLVLDLVIFEEHTRYTFTVFSLLIVVFAGLVAKLSIVYDYRNYVFAAIILAFCVCTFVFRVAFFYYRSRTKFKSI